MTSITRRDALMGAGAAVAVAGVPVAVLANANDANANAALLARIARWYEAYERAMEVSAFEGAHPKAVDEFYARGYGDAWGNLWAIQRELAEVRPNTLAGAAALLGCVERNATDRERRRE